MEIKDVEKLADMARIDLTLSEKEGILKDMEGILAYIKSISEVNTENISPQYDIKNVWREDLPDQNGDKFSTLVVGQFPEEEKGFLKVKKIL